MKKIKKEGDTTSATRVADVSDCKACLARATADLPPLLDGCNLQTGVK